MSRRGRACAAVGACLLVAGCVAAPSVGPTPVGTPAAQTGVPSAVPSETPGVTTSPTPTSPAAAEPWHAVVGDDAVSGAQWQDVTWTGSEFVAVGIGLAGGGAFLTSTDGRRWRTVPSGGTSGWPSDVAAGPFGLVATGSVDGWPTAWHSADGQHWTYRQKVVPAQLNRGDQVSITDVVATDTGWLAVGRDDPDCRVACGETPLRALVWTSTDAAAWDRIPAGPSMADAGINAVAAVDGGYVAVGQGAGHAVVWASPDGRAWDRVPDDPMFGPPAGAPDSASVSAVGVASRSGVVVAVGMGSGVGDGGAPVVMAWRSMDGRRWSPAIVEGAEEAQVFSVAATAGGFLATGPSGLGSCGGGIWASTDGTSWRCAASGADVPGFAPYAAAGSPDVDVAAGLTDVGWDPEGELGLPGAIWWRAAR